jgi:hypothetical protein
LSATNTLHVRNGGRGNPLHMYVEEPRLLTLIRSLEWIVIRVHSWGLFEASVGRPGEFLGDLPQIMPNLQRLCFGLRERSLIWGEDQGKWVTAMERYRVYTECVLLPIDDIVGQFGDALMATEAGLPKRTRSMLTSAVV